jgi:hypothetical protein
MRVAALYDIHRNLPAQETVLEEIREANVDHLVVGGDAVPGPLPRESLMCLLHLMFLRNLFTGTARLQCSNKWREGISQESRKSIDRGTKKKHGQQADLMKAAAPQAPLPHPIGLTSRRMSEGHSFGGPQTCSRSHPSGSVRILTFARC